MNPTGSPSFGSAPGAPAGGGPTDGTWAKEQVNVPSLLLLIGAAGGVLMNLVGMVQGMLGKSSIPPELAGKPEMQQFVTLMQGMQKAGPLFGILGIAVCAFVAFGGLKMRNLQSWPIALAACIVGSIPCCYSCCCVFTMAGGIWGLVVLNKPEVKAAFTA